MGENHEKVRGFDLHELRNRCSPAGWAAKRGFVTYLEELHGSIDTILDRIRGRIPFSRNDRPGAAVTLAQGIDDTDPEREGTAQVSGKRSRLLRAFTP